MESALPGFTQPVPSRPADQRTAHHVTDGRVRALHHQISQTRAVRRAGTAWHGMAAAACSRAAPGSNMTGACTLAGGKWRSKSR